MARLMGLDAPTGRAVDVITHDVFMQAIAELEADVVRKEAELVGHETPERGRSGPRARLMPGPRLRD
jgi:hypothetical protein